MNTLPELAKRDSSPSRTLKDAPANHFRASAALQPPLRPSLLKLLLRRPKRVRSTCRGSCYLAPSSPHLEEMKNFAPSPQPHTSVASGPAVSWLTKVKYPTQPKLNVVTVIVITLSIIFFLAVFMWCWCWCSRRFNQMFPRDEGDVELGEMGSSSEESSSSS